LEAMIPSQRTGDHDRLARFHALAPDQVEAGMSWLANHNPAVYSATIDAALVWDDGEATVDREPYCMVCRSSVDDPPYISWTIRRQADAGTPRRLARLIAPAGRAISAQRHMHPVHNTRISSRVPAG